MRYPYLIELRLGNIKWRVYKNTKPVRKAYPNNTQRVPHLTLYGPFRMKKGHSIHEVHTIIRKLSKNLDSLPYSINGWDTKQTSRGRAIAYKIEVSPEFDHFWKNLKNELNRVCIPQNGFDRRSGYWAHITLALKLNYCQYLDIASFIGMRTGIFAKIRMLFCKKRLKRNSNKGPTRPLNLKTEALRITILHNSKIHREYDLPMKKWLGRREALSSKIWGMTQLKPRNHQ